METMESPSWAETPLQLNKPLSDKSVQDCLFNNQPTLPENPIESMNGKPVFLQLPSEKRILFEHYWISFNCTPENEESVKDSIDSAKAEPESILETRKRNERSRGYGMDFIIGVETI
ncbi:hypothetical protein TNCV_2635981 [Trichonephila clavipes]|nr:hypothetical protein TNCV_2635981 [Trichonephila clavipes]